MGVWGWLKRVLGDEPSTSKTTRGPGKTGSDREAKARVQELNWLKKNHPALYKDAVLRHLGVVQDSSSPLQQLKDLAELQRTARRLGLADGGSSGDSLDRFIDKLPDLAQAAGPLVREMSGRAARPAPEPERPRSWSAKDRLAGAEIERASPDQPPALPAPRPSPPAAGVGDESPASRANPALIPIGGEATPSGPDSDISTEGDPMSLISAQFACQYALSELKGKSPDQAARWILAQNHAAVKGMIELIRATPDAQLLAMFESQAAAHPDFAPLMDWLRAQGEWTIQVARLLRDAGKPRGKRRPTAI